MKNNDFLINRTHPPFKMYQDLKGQDIMPNRVGDTLLYSKKEKAYVWQSDGVKLCADLLHSVEGTPTIYPNTYLFYPRACIGSVVVLDYQGSDKSGVYSAYSVVFCLTNQKLLDDINRNYYLDKRSSCCHDIPFSLNAIPDKQRVYSFDYYYVDDVRKPRYSRFRKETEVYESVFYKMDIVGELAYLLKDDSTLSHIGHVLCDKAGVLQIVTFEQHLNYLKSNGLTENYDNYVEDIRHRYDGAGEVADAYNKYIAKIISDSSGTQ